MTKNKDNPMKHGGQLLIQKQADCHNKESEKLVSRWV